MSPPSAISGLSDELLVAVFESLLADGDDNPKVVVPLLSVCKLWQVCGDSNAQSLTLTRLETLAQPLLVRLLVFTHGSQFAPVAARLEEATSRGKSLGHHIRTVSIAVLFLPGIDEDEDEDEETTNHSPLLLQMNYHLIRVMCQATHLQSFDMQNACRPSFLAALCSLPSRNSIQELDITLQAMSGEILNSVTPNLNHLQSLRRLTLTTYGNWPEASTPGISLPRLRHFHWEIHDDDEGASASALFLDRCDMSDVESLTIQTCDDAETLPEAFLSICRFINGLLHLRCLAIGIEENLVKTLLSLLPSRIVELDFDYADLQPGWVPLLPSSVHTLRISAIADDANDPIWDVLAQLLLQEPTYVRTITISLSDKNTNYIGPFSWTTGRAAMRTPAKATSDLATFTGRLLTYSSELSGKGIQVLDGQGCTASMHLFNV
jgi:hypothetical protein